jgi:DNA-binding Xre family transcriptional regulator
LTQNPEPEKKREGETDSACDSARDSERAVEAAFLAYEVTRPKKVDAPLLSFVAGPYRSPRVALGDVIECARFGPLVVRGWSNGPIPWPMGRANVGGRSSLILFGDLERAIRCESNRAVALAWGVTWMTVSHWRAALGVPRWSEGSKARGKQLAPISLTEAVQAQGRAALSPEVMERAVTTRRARGGYGEKPWSEEEIALLGTMLDSELSLRIGRPRRTIAVERNRRGIPSPFERGHLPQYQRRGVAIDGARVRARRLELGLLQNEVASRAGWDGARLSSIERGRIPRLEAASLQKLARALECEIEEIVEEFAAPRAV